MLDAKLRPHGQDAHLVLLDNGQAIFMHWFNHIMEFACSINQPSSLVQHMLHVSALLSLTFAWSFW